MSSATTRNPATGEDLKSYDLHTDQQVGEIVEAADTAFDSWRREPIETRADAVRQMGQLLRDNERELCELMTAEMGKPISQGSQEVRLCAAICKYTADNGPEALRETEQSKKGGRALVAFQPIGVIFGIQPWNFPIYQVIRYSAPQLVAGNTVLLKHAESVIGMGLRLEELYHEAGIPRDAFRTLLIDHEQSDDVIARPEVRGVTLTGSDVAGRHVAASPIGTGKIGIPSRPRSPALRAATTGSGAPPVWRPSVSMKTPATGSLRDSSRRTSVWIASPMRVTVPVALTLLSAPVSAVAVSAPVASSSAAKAGVACESKV